MSGVGWCFAAKPVLVSKHLFISLKSVPSTRPVKTTPTRPHNWSESVKEPIKRSAATRNMQHIHTVWSPMGHRGARKITELGPYHPSLSLSGRQRTPSSAHVFLWNVCVRERERRTKRVCQGAGPEQVKAGGLFGAIEIFQHVALGVGLEPIRRKAF